MRICSSGAGVNADAAGDGEIVAGDVAGGVLGEEGHDLMDLYDECLAAVRG